MKKLLLALVLIFPVFAHADVIRANDQGKFHFDIVNGTVIWADMKAGTSGVCNNISNTHKKDKTGQEYYGSVYSCNNTDWIAGKIIAKTGRLYIYFQRKGKPMYEAYWDRGSYKYIPG